MAEGWQANGYRIVHRPGHPLARKDGSVRAHRAALFDAQLEAFGVTIEALMARKIPCHWCGWEVRWGVTHRVRGTPEERWSALVVDHVDVDKASDDVEHLVASCPWCNSNREAAQRLGENVERWADTDPWDRPMYGARLAGLLRGKRKRLHADRRPQLAVRSELSPAAVAKAMRRADRLGRLGRKWPWIMGVSAAVVAASATLLIGFEPGTAALAALVVGMAFWWWWLGPPARARLAAAPASSHVGRPPGRPPIKARRIAPPPQPKPRAAPPPPAPEPEPEPPRPKPSRPSPQAGKGGLPRVDVGPGDSEGTVIRFPSGGDRVTDRRRRQKPGPPE